MAALATVADIEARIGEPITDDRDLRRVQALLDDVSGLVQSYCRRRFSPPVPAEVIAVVCSETISALNTTPGIRSESVGDMQVSYSYATGSGSLSSTSRTALSAYRIKFASVRFRSA